MPAEHASRNRPDEPPIGILIICGMLIAAYSLIGCAGRNFEAIRLGLEERGSYIEGVPFHSQGEASCGPAALAGIFEYWGCPADVEGIAAEIYLPELRGTLPSDMENLSQGMGFDAFSSAGTLEELKMFVRQGVPVICLLDLGFGVYRKPHYVTVIGYDEVNTVIIVHDGVKPNSLIGYERFDAAWSRAGRWMLVIMPRSGEKTHER